MKLSLRMLTGPTMVAAAWLLTCPASPARELDDYLGGTAVVDVENPGEFQLQTTGVVARHLWTDTTEVEYGLAAQWQISAAWGFGRIEAAALSEDDGGARSGKSTLWSAEMEARWRLDKPEAHWPVQMALAVGVQSEWLSGVSQQWTAEPRLILQKSVGDFSASLNIGAELGKQSTFTPSLGARYALFEKVMLACEVFEDFQARTRETVVLPQILFKPVENITVMAGCTLSQTAERNAQFEIGLIWDL